MRTKLRNDSLCNWDDVLLVDQIWSHGDFGVAILLSVRLLIQTEILGMYGHNLFLFDLLQADYLIRTRWFQLMQL